MYGLVANYVPDRWLMTLFYCDEAPLEDISFYTGSETVSRYY